METKRPRDKSNCRNRMTSLLVLVLMAIHPMLHAESTEKPNCTWVPADELIRKIEASLTMPSGHSLQEYHRYYAGERYMDRPAVIGVFVRSDQPGIDVVPQDELPRILDGGCSVVTMRYDVALDKIIYIRCNGVG